MPEGIQLTQGLNPMLTSVAINFLDSYKDQFIAKQIFPNVPSASPIGQYNVWKAGDFLRIQSKKLENRDPAPVIDFSTAKGSFSVDHYGVAANWSDIELAQARIGGIGSAMLINNKVNLVTLNGMLTLENVTASLIRTAGNWTTTAAGTTSAPVLGTSFIQWDQLTSDPVRDVIYYKRKMHLLTGFMPNVIVIPGQVMDQLRLNPSLIGRIQYTGTPIDPSQVTNEMIAKLFGIPKIIVPEGVYNAAAEGQAQSLTYFWGKDVWLGYVADAPGLTVPSAGYHFSWTGDVSQGLPAGMDPSGGGPQNLGSIMSPEGLFIRRYDTPRPNLHWVESEIYTTPNVTAADLGCLLTAVVA